MNYRHAFHAGNFADVLKHVVLIMLVEHLKKKPAPFFYLDTHAGRGLYDLSDAQPQRSGEYKGGIGRLLEAPAGTLPAEVAAYVTLVRESPLLAVIDLMNECSGAIISWRCSNGDSTGGETRPGDPVISGTPSADAMESH